MAEEWDYGNNWGAGSYDDWGGYTGGGYAGSDPSLGGGSWNPDQYTSPIGPGLLPGDLTSGGSGNWLSSILGSLGGLSGVLGPALQAGGALAGGAIGSNAAQDASRLQADALNRGIDLQTAQWLQQQSNLSPYLQAGQQGLSQLQQLAGREAPGVPGQIPTISGQGYPLPQIAPTWGPQAYQGPQAPNAGDYSWTPGQGPQAQDYRYTPGQTPDAAGYRWTPGQAPSAAQYRYTPGAVPTLSGKELLANDPGVQFRMDEGRKALEASAAARGGLLSGPTLAALQRQGQELSSQEYGNAWNRASQQAQLREQWGQAASQMGFGQAAEEARLREGWAQQASQQGFGQAEAASRLREQVNQIASQQGWTQAQAESVFREQMAQQAGAQNWGQALQGQQNQFNQGLSAQQWEQQQRQAYDQSVYDRMMQQSGTQYARDVSQNEQDYARQQAQYRQQLAQYMLPWEQQSTLANLGGQATGMFGQQGQGATNAISNLLGQLGTTQGMGVLGSAGQWNTALAGGIGGLQNVLKGLNA